MKRFFVHMSLLVGVGLFSARACSGEVTGSSPTSVPAKTPNCEIESVLAFASFLGKAPEEKQRAALCEAYPQVEISMHDVQQAAKQVGLSLQGIRANLLELEGRGRPFIAVLPNHFAFIEHLERNWVCYSQNGLLLIEPRAQFEAKYQGKALVLTSDEAINGLHISPSIVAWNKVPLGTLSKTAVVTLTNTSRLPILIDKVSTSCACTVPSKWPRQVMPGQKVPMQITLQLPGAGEFSQSVTISSSRSHHQVVSLFGNMEADISLSPAQVSFGEIVSGSTATKVLTLRDIDHKLPRPLQVKTTDANVVSRITRRSEDSWDISLTLSAVQLGDLDAHLLISGPTKGSRAVHVPIHSRIIPMTRSRPEQIVFGSVAGGGATRRLRIFRQDRQPFEILDVVAPSYLSKELEHNLKRSEWSIHISIDSAKAPTQVTDKVTVKTISSGRKEDITISVLALNEEISGSVLPGVTETELLPRAEDEAGVKIGSALPLLRVGEPASDFRVIDAKGNPWHLNALHGQKNVLLTFFPKCFTGGCATQLSSLRNHQQEFDAAQTQILAVSVDPAEGDGGQLAFAKKWGFEFPLIPDTKRQLSKQFGAIQKDDERAARLSFLIDKKGVVRWVDTEVHVDSHGADMLLKIKELNLTQ